MNSVCHFTTTEADALISHIREVFAQDHLQVTEKFIDKDILNINCYIEERMKDRPDHWSKELSKKEKVLCKIAMIDKMLTWLDYTSSVGEHFHHLMKSYISVLRASIHKFPTKSKDGHYIKWPGISSDDASILNELYLHANKLYQKKLYI